MYYGECESSQCKELYEFIPESLEMMPSVLD